MSQIHLIAALLAISASEILDSGKAVGTASNQYLLGSLIVGLIGIVIYRERQQNRQHQEATTATIKAAEKVEETNRLAAVKASQAIVEAQERHQKAERAFENERKELMGRMERQTNEMNEERRARWTMMIDVIRENTISFRENRAAMDSLKQFLIDNAKRPAA